MSLTILTDFYNEEYRIHKAHFSFGNNMLVDNPVFTFMLKKDTNIQSVQLPWSQELETFLFDKKIKMSTVEEEQDRLANLFLSNLRYADDQWSKDCVNPALKEVLSEQRYDRYHFQESINNIHTAGTPSKGQSYHDCCSFIRHAVSGLCNSTQLVLGYDGNQTISIIDESIKIAIDKRFRITLRKILFPSH
jgi:hypothetical protein